MPGWRLSYSYRYFLTQWESPNIRTLCQKRRIFMTWKNLGHVVSRTEICGWSRQSFPNPIKSGLSPEKKRDELNTCDTFTRKLDYIRIPRILQLAGENRHLPSSLPKLGLLQMLHCIHFLFHHKKLKNILKDQPMEDVSAINFAVCEGKHFHDLKKNFWGRETTPNRNMAMRGGRAKGISNVVWSKSFRPDQLFKVTEIKQLCYFST